MGVVLDLLKPEIDLTLKRLDKKVFDPDPIAGPHFSKITSVMSSAYKRHGHILERAILETLRLCDNFVVWHDPLFQVPSAVDHIVTGCITEPTKLIGTDYPYSQGDRTLQLDAIVFNKSTGILSAYEVKRGFGPHDSGKRLQMLPSNEAMSPATRLAMSSSITANARYKNRSVLRGPRWISISVGPYIRQSMR
jgi:hypothetical protein